MVLVHHLPIPSALLILVLRTDSPLSLLVEWRGEERREPREHPAGGTHHLYSGVVVVLLAADGADFSSFSPSALLVVEPKASGGGRTTQSLYFE